MSNLLSSGSDGKEHYYLYDGITSSELAEKVKGFFENEGYKLEEGSVESGVYGTGNAVLRFFLGALVKRYKFKIQIDKNEDKVRLSIREAMSGFSGGVLGMSKMGSERKKITRKIEENL